MASRKRMVIAMAVVALVSAFDHWAWLDAAAHRGDVEGIDVTGIKRAAVLPS